ncbi:16S rRNA (cytidine(1402)-2'-O)-methyltransferase [Sporosarcina sp. E16_8]|uniref:16S rRNA (cytidine(1402)-2'-O)-methyltransferase n=1 Tax=Sporosarcina sp. E16_8 TaxID=2789295 RepID=UPI001A9368A5|nr:16S rRNA (cytidine(1402)-2'-O)-methyltransferase [Sporosarcina sp. E16_8]MBO0588060.1 16S rRNA (cytidine(1402)-2'-O)-methyltransferase [Sporosarcina sp. E16_8]
MKSQKSAEPGGGKLFLVGTPIGNLEDMTYRAIRILKEVDMIAAEDTRNTIRLCNHFEIKTSLTSYHEHNIEVGGEKILAMLADGKTVALVSDAGMPCISDPGADIVAKAISAGYDVVPVPGANAAISALVASGLVPQPFMFFGFLSRQKKARNIQLDDLKQREETVILYEAPHRLKETLRALQTSFGGTRSIVLARELTKRFEEFLRGTLEEAVLWAESNEIRGEFCIVIEGSDGVIVEEKEEWWNDLEIRDHVTELMERKDLRSKEAIREVANSRGLSRRDVYKEFHVEDE